MGITGIVTIGVLTLTAIGTYLGFKKKEGERYEKVQQIIRDVDLGKPEVKEEKEEPAEKIIDDVENAFKEMGLDDDAQAYAEAMSIINDAVKGLKNNGVSVEETLQSVIFENDENAQQIVDNSSILEMAEKRKNFEAKMQKLQEEANDPEKVREREEQLRKIEEMEEAKWRREVERAIESKNFNKLEDLFDEKYAGGPWHPSPASVFGDARNEGVITDELYHEASEKFGRLWNYSGD